MRVGGRLVVRGQILVVLAVPERPGRCERHRARELRAVAREERIVGRGPRQRQREVEVVGVAVAHDGKVLPVLERVAGEGHLCREHEVVVGPAQALSPSERGPVELDVLVGVVVALVVVIIVVVVTVEVVHVVVHVATIIIGGGDVALLRVEQAHGELDGALVAEPVGRVAGVQRFVVAAVGLEVDAERLAVADGHNAPVLLVLVEEVGHREVVQLQAHAADDTGLSPTERELHLVVRLLLQVPVDVNGSVFLVGYGRRVDLLRVEVSHRGQLACRAHQGVLREQVAGLGAQFAAHDILIQPVVAIDSHAADVGLRSL